MKKQRVVVVGAGIAGSLITTGLADRDDIELVCLERVTQADHAEAGTGLNVGPNAMKALKLHLPETAAAIVANSYPWESWKISITDGTVLTDLKIESVADNHGIRIRWSELYSLLRTPVQDYIQYGCKVTGCGKSDTGSHVEYRDPSGKERRIDDIDLLIGGDGRYSVVREYILGGSDSPFFLGVCLYRVLFPAETDCPIYDYEQWFSGPNRLLAFRVPGDFVYCAGSFPIAADREIPEEMRTPAALGKIYLPPSGEPSRKAGYLIDKIQQYFDKIHWARLQEGRLTYGNTPGILLVGDSAHPMVPTLGQGATQACEDACVVVDEIGLALAERRSLASVPSRVEDRRLERIQFVVDFSRDATDTMLEGADSVAGSLEKAKPPFLEKLARLYRDVPLPSKSLGGR
jgi:2-polyprenyl-6-methoxyphenol hydroxylase-like FAD-dependent oxidoreductase